MGDDYIHFCRITARANWCPEGGQRARIEQVLKDELGVYVHFDDPIYLLDSEEYEQGEEVNVVIHEGLRTPS